ncbi:SHOCT domain-containing protein [Pseudonocardia alni]|uniref:SHOCT domain-containing protein n=1 Tax=Pseudonocardia alni TaxID=33907 RepID=UPI00331E52B6
MLAALGVFLLLAAVIAGGVVLLRRGTGDRADRADDAPEDLLAERFARGAIDEQEYRRRLEILEQREHRRRGA